MSVVSDLPHVRETGLIGQSTGTERSLSNQQAKSTSATADRTLCHRFPGEAKR